MKRTGVSGLKLRAPRTSTINLSLSLLDLLRLAMLKSKKNRIKHKFSLANGAKVVYTLAVLTRGHYRTGY